MQISRPFYINILLTTNLNIFRHNVKGCRSQMVQKDYYNGHMIMFSKHVVFILGHLKEVTESQDKLIVYPCSVVVVVVVVIVNNFKHSLL